MDVALLKSILGVLGFIAVVGLLVDGYKVSALCVAGIIVVGAIGLFKL